MLDNHLGTIQLGFGIRSFRDVRRIQESPSSRQKQSYGTVALKALMASDALKTLNMGKKCALLYHCECNITAWMLI